MKKYFTWVLLLILVSSCNIIKTSHRKCKPLNKALVYSDTIPDYFYINNTIVMIDKNN
jgi:hypothetical protein